MLSIDRSAIYEVQEAFSERDGCTAYAVREKSLGAHGLLYRVALSARDRNALKSRFEGIVLPYASIVHPSMPLLGDAWFTDDYFSFVLLMPKCQPLRPEGPNPLATADPAHRAEMLGDMLDCLAALHEHEIAHTHLRASCFGVDSIGRILLHDPGLADRLLIAQSELDESNPMLRHAARFRLSANMKAHDVACWAASVASLLLRHPVLGYDFDEWDQTELRNAEGELSAIVTRSAPLVDFLMEAMKARTFEGGGFASAAEAVAAFEKIRAAQAAL